MMQARRTGCAACHICQQHTDGGTPAPHCNQPYEKVEQDTHRDYFMTAEEAREYGIVDLVLANDRIPVPLKQQ